MTETKTNIGVVFPQSTTREFHTIPSLHHTEPGRDEDVDMLLAILSSPVTVSHIASSMKRQIDLRSIGYDKDAPVPRTDPVYLLFLLAADNPPSPAIGSILPEGMTIHDLFSQNTLRHSPSYTASLFLGYTYYLLECDPGDMLILDPTFRSNDMKTPEFIDVDSRWEIDFGSRMVVKRQSGCF